MTQIGMAMNIVTRNISVRRKILQSVKYTRLPFPSGQCWSQGWSQSGLHFHNSRFLSSEKETLDSLKEQLLPPSIVVEGNGEKISSAFLPIEIAKPLELDSSASLKGTIALTNLADLAKYLKSSNSPMNPSIVGRGLTEIVKTGGISRKEVEEQVVEVMRLLKAKIIYANFNKAVAALIREVLMVLRKEGDMIDDKVKMEVFILCGQLKYRYGKITSSDRRDVKALIEGIKINYISQSFPRYVDYLSTLTKMEFFWKDLSQERRKQLLSCMNRFGDVTKEGLSAAERLVYEVDNLLIVKDHLRELQETDKRWYETMLNKLLEEKYGSQSIRSGESEERRTIAFPVLFQLRALAADRGKRLLSDHQMELIYKGLIEDTNTQEMNLYHQCLTILTLGDLSINYRSLPAELWKTMLRELSKNIKQKGIKATKVSELLKGLRGMQVNWKGLDAELKEAMIEAVANMNEDGRSTRELANAIFYLGNLEVSWKEDVSEERKKRILQGIDKSWLWNARDISNILYGLGKMRVLWETMNEDTKRILLSGIERKSVEMNERDISNILYSMATIKVSWETVPVEAKNALYRAIESNLLFMKEFGFNSTIYGLEKMGVSVKEVPDSVKAVLESALKKIAKIQQPSHRITTLIYQLTKMGYTWQSFCEETQELLAEMILKSVKEFSPQDLSTTMFSIAIMMKNYDIVCKKNYFIDLQIAIIKKEYELKNGEEKIVFANEGKHQVNVYFSWLQSLPPAVLNELRKGL